MRQKKSGSMHLGRLGAVTSLILRHLSEVDMLKVNCIGLHLTVHLKWIVLSFFGGKKSSWNTQRLVYVSFSSELKNEIDFSKKNKQHQQNMHNPAPPCALLLCQVWDRWVTCLLCFAATLLFNFANVGLSWMKLSLSCYGQCAVNLHLKELLLALQSWK